MELFFRQFGHGSPVIILHGLYGSSDNWVTTGKILAEDFKVFLIDQRNHGNSPHSPEHNYNVLKNDLLQFMNDHNLEKAVLIGHSMGGKTAMSFATEYSERVQALIVVDIAPGPYKNDFHAVSKTPNFMNIMSAMLGVDFSKVKSRSDADKQLEPVIPSARSRQFLLKNIVRTKDNQYTWKLNIKALYDQLPEIMDGLKIKNFTENDRIRKFPVLFIKGEKSNFISADDTDIIQTIFPESRIITIPDAGHWLHAEKPDLFIKTVKDFLHNKL